MGEIRSVRKSEAPDALNIPTAVIIATSVGIIEIPVLKFSFAPLTNSEKMCIFVDDLCRYVSQRRDN